MRGSAGQLPDAAADEVALRRGGRQVQRRLVRAGRVGAAACEAMARNPAARPAIQLALILGLAFIESLVLFTLVIIFAKVV